MNQPVLSLRARLFVLILAPLLLVSLLLGFWRYSVAQSTAEELFDRGLLSTALAISRDVAISDGDALSLTTRDLVKDATGGELFYHVTGPGGIYVTGYAYPPRFVEETKHSTPIYAVAEYRGEQVRALKLTERTSIGNLSGDTTVTVWQRFSERRQFARDLALRNVALMTVLLATLALVVWFGVQLGLRPLRDLHDAIALRSPDDLSQIKRPLPGEVTGIVGTLNRLFSQVENSIENHQVFISDAAHQLRNPSAAVLSMAETLVDVEDPLERKKRIAELIEAARGSARVSEQLLSLERLRHDHRPIQSTDFDLVAAVEEACAALGAQVLGQGIDFELVNDLRELIISGDRALIIEAIKNLIDNARRHGGKQLSRITVEMGVKHDTAWVTVADDGKGLRPDDADIVFRRFGQLTPSSGSGLGLAIVASIAQRHAGRLQIDDCLQGASLTFFVPVAN